MLLYGGCHYCIEKLMNVHYFEMRKCACDIPMTATVD